MGYKGSGKGEVSDLVPLADRTCNNCTAESYFGVSSHFRGHYIRSRGVTP